MISYETRVMSTAMCVRFLNWFADNIGTETEVNPEGSYGDAYVVCLELTPSEADRITKWFENEDMRIKSLSKGKGWKTVRIAGDNSLQKKMAEEAKR